MHYEATVSRSSPGSSLRVYLSVNTLGYYSEEASHFGSWRANMRRRCPSYPVNNIGGSLPAFSVKKGFVEFTVAYDTSGEFRQEANFLDFNCTYHSI